MRISTFFYTLRQGFLNLFRNKWFPLASIATIASCLFLLSVFYSVVVNLQNIVHLAEQNVCVTVFFHNDYDGDLCDGHDPSQVASSERIAEIGEMLKARVEVSKVEYTSADEAWATMGPKYYGEDYSDGFSENPLKGLDNYKVYVSDVSMHDTLVGWIHSIPEVRKVNDASMVANLFSGGNRMITAVSVAIILILLGVSILLIRNTISTGINVRKEEINIMKYIGATDFFVRAPFVVEGALIGILGAVIPLWLTYEIYNYAVEYLQKSFSMLSSFLQFLPVEEVFHVLIPVSLAIGVGIGLYGSISSARKHLHV